MNYRNVDITYPNYFYCIRDSKGLDAYSKGIKVKELFNIKSVGIITGNDKEFISFEPFNNNHNKLISYKPFDYRFINYNKNLLREYRYKVMQHFINYDNIGLLLERIVPSNKDNFTDVFITNKIIDAHTIGSASYIFPLYIYPESNANELSNESLIGRATYICPLYLYE